eukprot:CAMPEP_0181257550 /NCGR_PEP_ID=MMETSP1096-20121128/50305_1 /TAXON_ID=156174 ORGANISM="Chrysochromulina ericina, Strain CCMP281" /NCGR_SAMPLE_ID=MMETSP1096 /ASSEMBLY_ACC=CAM_ASM_000453 /LENGTH=147 /DNA_ID=CAMNT_0023355877 /DNA_START=457 /DNA_END=900 /DNA_ORIENTATION=-
MFSFSHATGSNLQLPSTPIRLTPQLNSQGGVRITKAPSRGNRPHQHRLTSIATPASPHQHRLTSIATLTGLTGRRGADLGDAPLAEVERWLRIRRAPNPSLPPYALPAQRIRRHAPPPPPLPGGCGCVARPRGQLAPGDADGHTCTA